MSQPPELKPVALHRPAAPIALPLAATWPLADVLALFDLPFNDLMFQAQAAHRANFPAGDVELATLLSIKTGGCEEDCSYCPQAARYDTGVEAGVSSRNGKNRTLRLSERLRW